MKNILSLTVYGILFLGLIAFVFPFGMAIANSTPFVGQVNIDDEKLKAIEEYCSSEKALLPDSEPHKIFADISDDEKPEWKEFKSVKELEDFREKSETYTIYYVWQHDNKISATSATIFSGSGDWSKYVRSCFRPNGSLAKASIDYRTFYGDFRMTNDIYFDEKGKVLQESQKFTKLGSDEPANPDKETLRDNTMMEEVDHYLKTSKLPFIKLLQKR